jgi:hypothetical protein
MSNEHRPEPSAGYASYLLRLWHTQSAGDVVWRASLEEPLTGRVERFATLPGLFAFLQLQTGQGSEGDGREAETALPGAP